MGELLLGTTLLASFLGGLVALLAPCCISVMLPAYFATGFRNHGGVVPATLVFGGGVATVILPIGLGATALSRLLIEQHTVVFLIGGVLMLLGGVAMLVGWKPNLPMPAARAARGAVSARPTCSGCSPGWPAPAARRCWPESRCCPGRRRRSPRRWGSGWPTWPAWWPR